MLKTYKIQCVDSTLDVLNYENDKSITPQLERGMYEPHVQAAIYSIVKSKPNFRCLDIGANVGIHSMLFDRISSHRVVCVEASSENVEVLNKNFELNGFEKPVVHNVFLGDGSEVSFSRAESNHACSFTATTNHSQRDEVRQTVKTTKLSEIIDWQPDVIKIDIEGAEYNTIMSSTEIFENAKFVIVELNKFTNEKFFGQPISMLTDLLLDMYNVYAITGHGLQKVTRGDLANFFQNSLMLDVVCTKI